MPMPILLHNRIERRNIQIKNISLYNSASADGNLSIEDSDYPSPCPYPGSYPPPASLPLPLRVDPMPPKSVTIFSPDTLDEDDDDDLPPLIDAPIQTEAEVEIEGNEDDEDAPPPLVDVPPDSDPNAESNVNASMPHGAGEGVQYTFSTVTPSTLAFGADVNADVRESEERVSASASASASDASPTLVPSPTVQSTAGAALTSSSGYATTTTGPHYPPGLPHPHPPPFATRYTHSDTLGRSQFLAHPLSCHAQAQSRGGGFGDDPGSGSIGGGREIGTRGGFGGGGAFVGGAAAFGGRAIEPPSPSNADMGSPSPAPSPSYAGDSTTTTTTTTSYSQLSAQLYQSQHSQHSGDSGHSDVTQPHRYGYTHGQDGPREIEFALRLESVDEQREPASGPQRTGYGQGQSVQDQAHDQGQTFVFATPNTGAGTGKKQGRPPSYIPRPPNAFILFRASFVRSQRFGGGSSTAIAGVRGKGSSSPGLTTGGVSALGPGSVVTIEESHDTRPPSPSSRRGSTAGLSLPPGPTPSTSLSKMAGQIWRAMPAHERAVWEARARTAQAEHRAKYPDWRFRPENASGVEAWSTDRGGNGGDGGGTDRGGGAVRESRGAVREGVGVGGGGRGEGSALWSGGTGGGDTWEGMVAVGKYKAGGSTPDTGARRDGAWKGKDRDFEQSVHSEKEDEGGGGRGGKTKTGVGTSPEPYPNPSLHGDGGTGTSPGGSSSTHTSGSRTGVRTRAQTRARASTRAATKAISRARASPKARGNGRRTRANTAMSTNTGSVANAVGTSIETANEQSRIQPFGLPSWAARGLESPEASPGASAKLDARATNAGTKGDEHKAESMEVREVKDPAKKEEPRSDADPRNGAQMPSGSLQPVYQRSLEVERQHESTPGQGEVTVQAERSEQKRVHEDKNNEDRSQPHKEHDAGPDDARFTIPLTDIARRSTSTAPSASSTSAPASAHQEMVPSAVHIHAPTPSVPVTVSATDDENRMAASRAGTGSQDREQMSPQTRASSGQVRAVQGQAGGGGQDFARDFPYFARQGQEEGREQDYQHSQTIAHNRSISQPYLQVQVFSRMQEQASSQLQNQVQTLTEHRGQVSTTVRTVQGAPTGVIRTGRRNTVSVPGGAAVPVSGVSFRFPPGQDQDRVVTTAPATVMDGGAGVSPFGYGEMYTYERVEEHASPPPLSPAVSSPLSATSPTYGYGSPPMPFAFSPSSSVRRVQYENGHPYAHARAHSHSFHQPLQTHRPIQTQGVMSPMMHPVQAQARVEHTQPQAQIHSEQTGFVFPTSPSHYGQNAAAIGATPEYGQNYTSSGASIPMDMDVDLGVETATHAVSSTAGSVSMPSQQAFSSGEMTQNYISTYSSLTEWAGGTTPYSGVSAASSGIRMHSPLIAGDGSGASTSMTTSSANAQAFSRSPYEHPYPRFDSGLGVSAGGHTGGGAGHWCGYGDSGNITAMPYHSHSGGGRIGDSSAISYEPGTNLASTPSLTSDTPQQIRQHQQTHQFQREPESEFEVQTPRESFQYGMGSSQASEFYPSEVVPTYTPALGGYREQRFAPPGMQGNYSQHVATSGDTAGEDAYVVQHIPAHAEMGSPYQRFKEKRK